MESTRECVDCGVSIAHRHRNAKRCQHCSRAAQRRMQAEQNPPKGECLAADDENGCNTGRLRLGYCSRHYSRVKRYGSPNLPEPIDHWSRYRVADSGCWEWIGPLHASGYGHSPASMGDGFAHRAFFLRYVGPIPNGLDIDHLCRNRRCVNPKHLEPVTRQVNVQRGADARLAGRCSKDLHDLYLPGHWYVDPSTGGRRCRECWRISYRKAGRAYRDRRQPIRLSGPD